MAKSIKVSDVANRLGISKTTVSHALSGNRPTSSRTRKRVFEAVRTLGYTPNYAARTLATKKTMLVAILAPDMSNPFTASLLSSFGKALSANSYNMLLAIVEEHDCAVNYLRQFASGMVDGIINMVPAISALEARALCQDLPLVTFMRDEIECPTYVDYIDGAKSAMSHLWGLGHRKIGMIAFHENAPDANEEGRVLGYREFLHMQGQTNTDELLFFGSGHNDSELAHQAECLYKKGVTAIFTSNDEMATGVINWSFNKGLKVPDDLSVIGFNDSPIAHSACPPLTTVQLPIRPLAQSTVEALLSRMNGGRHPSQKEFIIPRLVVRSSTSKPKIVS